MDLVPKFDELHQLSNEMTLVHVYMHVCVCVCVEIDLYCHTVTTRKPKSAVEARSVYCTFFFHIVHQGSLTVHAGGDL